jgi:phage repressor protein C with HTH and peptisase S24 domain
MFYSLLSMRAGDAAIAQVEHEARIMGGNPAYPPVEVSLDDVEVVGRVVWKGGRL